MKTITNETAGKFEEYLRREERSGNTISKYMRDIRLFRAWLGERPIDKAAVSEYKKLCAKGTRRKALIQCFHR